MEAARFVMDRRLLLILAFVLLLRVPFLNQAIQGDDSFYLTGAEHALIDPAHPHHATYVFRGKEVDMRGHPHPPLNAWMLALLLAVFGDVYEVRFHAAYVLFTVVAALAMWSLAVRFTRRPALATLLFLATPAFVVNGNSFESDVPFLAFWMAAVALFVSAVDRDSAARLAAACLAMCAAAMTAYQAVVLVPILAVYLRQKRRSWVLGWVALLTPPAVLAAWQLYERLSTGSLPAAVLAGYLQTHKFQELSAKLSNAAALTAHLTWVVFPGLALLAYRKRWSWIAAVVAAAAAALLDPNPLFWASLGIGVLLLVNQRLSDFLSAWILIFFAAALVLFFAGSARYLLPIAAPVALLVSQRVESRWLAAGVVLEAALSLALAAVNYQHWDGYRHFTRVLPSRDGAPSGPGAVWVNGEWGLRFYLESDGGLPLVGGQAVRPGDLVVSSRLAYPTSFTTGGGKLVPLVEREIRPAIPLRMIALNTRSAYSTASLGLRPFDISAGTIDVVRADAVVERKPALEYLPMNSPEAESQIVSDVYQLEEGRYRWMGEHAVILLKRPATPMPLRVVFYRADKAPARRVTLWLDGKQVGEQSCPSPGLYTLSTSGPVTAAGETASVEVTVDQTFLPPGDQRRLGVILSEVGFRQ